MDMFTYQSMDVGQLIQNLHSSDRFTRRKAALELGKRREISAVDELINLLDDHETVWDAAGDAAWALGEIGDERAINPLIAVLDHVFCAGQAVEALGKIHAESAIEPLIRYFMRVLHPSVATVLGNWGDKRAVEPLIAAMSSSDQRLRFYAARALGKLGDERALPVLKHVIVSGAAHLSNTQSVSYVAAKAVERIKSLNKE